MKTILAIGDEKDFDSFKKFFKQQKFFKKHNFVFKTADYASLFRGELPEVKTRDVVVFLFFPFEYWETHIETKKSREVYGNKNYFIKFGKFWKRVDKRLNSFYKNKKIHYINRPGKLHAGRDKLATKRILTKSSIPVPKNYSAGDYKKILKMLDNGQSLFIKVRYGSMGKGISYCETLPALKDGASHSFT